MLSLLSLEIHSITSQTPTLYSVRIVTLSSLTSNFSTSHYLVLILKVLDLVSISHSRDLYVLLDSSSSMMAVLTVQKELMFVLMKTPLL
jgi:hypothetical protein